MTADPWLPVGHKITDEIVVGALLFSGEGWQIYRTLLGDRVLVAEPVLIYKWTTSGLISEDLIRSASFGPHTIGFLACSKGYDLYPVQQGKSPDAKVDALAFSAALKESRKLIIEVSFHDAIYVEQYSRLLPTFTLSPPAEDERVLGMWVTGGVNVSTKSFRRLCQLTGWLTSSDLAEIVTAAGLASETGIALLSREKPNLGGVRNDDDAASNSSTAQDITVRHHGTEISYPSFLLPGRPQLEAFFNDYVIDIIQHPDKYDHLGITFPPAIVLFGPPGCGKTYAVERLVEFIDWPSFSVDSNTIGSPYIHETSKKISAIFEKAIDSAPSVLVIDEMESFLSDRFSGGTSGLHHVEEVAEFLRRIPEAANSKVLIIGMTNMIEAIDPAILRRGRFDHVIRVEMPSREESAALLQHLLGRIPTANDLDLDLPIGILTGRPLSDSAFVVREAARIAARAGKSNVDQESLEIALDLLSGPNERKSKPIGFFWD